MTMVNQGLAITLSGPDIDHVFIIVTDPLGRQAGANPQSGLPINPSIPGSQYSGRGRAPQTLSIPENEEGHYVIQVLGDIGPSWRYELDYHVASKDGLKSSHVDGVTPNQIISPSPLLAAAASPSPPNGVTFTLNYDSVYSQQTKLLGESNLPPVAFDDFAATTTNRSVALNVLANDNDPDAWLNTNSVMIVTHPANGTVSVNPTNGILTYTPTNGFVGTNTFAYTVQDNQGATSNPGLVTVIVTEPVLTTNAPPVAVNDFASTSNGLPVTIDVLANDVAPDGTLDPGTVTLTRAPTNGTATVDVYTGAITYTPNPGFAGTNTFRYTVQDDLGATSPEATVTIAVAPPAPALPDPRAPKYFVDWDNPIQGRHPSINDLGEMVYEGQSLTVTQVFSSVRGQLTFPGGGLTDARSPAIANDGSFVCYGAWTNGMARILKYPGPVILDNSSRAPSGSSGRTVEDHLSLSADGEAMWSYNFVTDFGDFTRKLLTSSRGAVSVGGNWSGDYPDIDADGNFVYAYGSSIYLNNTNLFPGRFPRINDAPKDNHEIVYVSSSGENLMSRRVGQLRDRFGAPLTGSWVDINREGTLAIEKFTNGAYHVFKAYLASPCIISTPGTNALVGLPYRYDSDNLVESYGAEAPPLNWHDPIYWTVVSAPEGFAIDASTGRIDWVPTAPGAYTITVRAAWMYEDGWEAEDTQSWTVYVKPMVIEVVDAVSFRLTNSSPDLFPDPNPYFRGGIGRSGAQADGASRLVLRVELRGAETNAFANLHFAIAGTNAANNGRLRSIGGTTWTLDAPAAIAASLGTNKAVCVYQSPDDFDLASNPVTVQLINGSNVVAAANIQLKRPPVVLVHDQWSSPDVWPVVLDRLMEAGFEFKVADYAYNSGLTFSNNNARVFDAVVEAIATSRQAGFAASRVTMVGHGAGGILARLHVQQHSAQGENYFLGDVQKLITIGTPHGGSYLAAFINGLKTNNPSAYATLRTNLLAASEASGQFPPVDLNQGVVADEVPGSAALLALESLNVPSHAIATVAEALPPGDPWSLLHHLLGVSHLGDGFVTSLC